MARNRVPHKQDAEPRIGAFGIGLAAYGPRFPGQRARLESWQPVVVKAARDRAARSGLEGEA